MRDVPVLTILQTPVLRFQQLLKLQHIVSARPQRIACTSMTLTRT